MVIKQKQPRPQMEVHVQRQLSKNVVQHPLQGRSPCLQMEQLWGVGVGGLLKQPGDSRPSSAVLCFPTGPKQTCFLSDQPESLAPLPPPTQRDQMCDPQGPQEDRALPPALPQPALLSRLGHLDPVRTVQGTQEGRVLPTRLHALCALPLSAQE